MTLQKSDDVLGFTVDHIVWMFKKSDVSLKPFLALLLGLLQHDKMTPNSQVTRSRCLIIVTYLVIAYPPTSATSAYGAPLLPPLRRLTTRLTLFSCHISVYSGSILRASSRLLVLELQQNLDRS